MLRSAAAAVTAGIRPAATADAANADIGGAGPAASVVPGTWAPTVRAAVETAGRSRTLAANVHAQVFSRRDRDNRPHAPAETAILPRSDCGDNFNHNPRHVGRHRELLRSTCVKKRSMVPQSRTVVNH